MQPGTKAHMRAFCQRDLKPPRISIGKVLLRSEESKENVCLSGRNEKRLRASGDVGRGGNFPQCITYQWSMGPLPREIQGAGSGSLCLLLSAMPQGAMGSWALDQRGHLSLHHQLQQSWTKDRPGAEHHFCMTDSLWSLLLKDIGKKCLISLYFCTNL